MAERERTCFEDGRQAGEKSLGQQLLQQRTELLQLQNGLFESLRQILPQQARETETALVDLATEIANKIVKDIPITHSMVEKAVQEAIQQVEATTQMTILLHPEDLTLLQRVNSPTLLPQGQAEQLQFQPSPDVTRGGCIVETRFGLLDGRRETRLAMIRKELHL